MAAKAKHADVDGKKAMKLGVASDDTTTIQYDNYTVLKLLLFYLFGRLLTIILILAIAQAKGQQQLLFFHPRTSVSLAFSENKPAPKQNYYDRTL